MKELLDRGCFKIDSANAKAMIVGFSKEGKIIHQCIYCLARRKKFPKLITLDKTPTRFELSERGKTLHAEHFQIPLKYVALLEKQYFIRYDSGIWDKVCNNGLFDIWDPISPYNRFAESKLNPQNFSLVLLRIYEIEDLFHEADIKWNDRHHTIIGNDLRVTLKKPVVNDEEFRRIKSLLELSIKDYELSRNLSDNGKISNIRHKSITSKAGFANIQSLSERNFENVICERLDDIEEGLTLVRRQYSIDPVGRIDILCNDKNGDLVVIELKKFGAPNYSIIDQITRYMGCIEDKIAHQGQKVRGIIIVGKKDERLEYSARTIPNLIVKTFKFIIE